MSDLPPELRPQPIKGGAALAAQCQQEVASAIAASDGWLFVRLVGNTGQVSLLGGNKGERDADGLMVAAMEAWAMAGEARGDEQPRRIVNYFKGMMGATTEYVSGGVVPVRK